MPLDPRIQAFLGQAGLLTQPGSTPRKPEILLAEQRAAAEKAKPMAALASELEPVAHVENLVIAGPAGDLPVRLYTPEGTGPFPVLLFFQKSWCAGNLDTHQIMCRGLCRGAGCLVLTVDYRLAPEHPFPPGWKIVTPLPAGWPLMRQSSRVIPHGSRLAERAGVAILRLPSRS